MAEWLKATDCKSVPERVRWFESTPAQLLKRGWTLVLTSFFYRFWKVDENHTRRSLVSCIFLSVLVGSELKKQVSNWTKTVFYWTQISKMSPRTWYGVAGVNIKLALAIADQVRNDGFYLLREAIEPSPQKVTFENFNIKKVHRNAPYKTGYYLIKSIIFQSLWYRYVVRSWSSL